MLLRSLALCTAVALLIALPPTPAMAVVGGSPVRNREAAEFQYSAGILGRGFNCSGVLISDRHVLTAGHCVTGGVAASQLEVVFAAVIPQQTPVNNVAAIHRHPDYEDLHAITEFDYFHANDLAILELTADAPDFKEPIRLLPDADYASLVDGSSSSVSGYGLTANYRDYAENGAGVNGRLHTAEILLTGFDDSVDAGPKLLADSSQPPSANFGDSGGPLTREIMRNGVTQNYLIGVVSEGFDPEVPPDGNILDFQAVGPGSYSSYTPVGPYAAWISSVTGVVVPEPSTCCLAVFVAISVGAMMRRQRSAVRCLDSSAKAAA